MYAQPRASRRRPRRVRPPPSVCVYWRHSRKPKAIAAKKKLTAGGGSLGTCINFFYAWHTDLPATAKVHWVGNSLAVQRRFTHNCLCAGELCEDCCWPNESTCEAGKKQCSDQCPGYDGLNGADVCESCCEQGDAGIAYCRGDSDIRAFYSQHGVHDCCNERLARGRIHTTQSHFCDHSTHCSTYSFSNKKMFEMLY